MKTMKNDNLSAFQRTRDMFHCIMCIDSELLLNIHKHKRDVWLEVLVEVDATLEASGTFL